MHFLSHFDAFFVSFRVETDGTETDGTENRRNGKQTERKQTKKKLFMPEHEEPIF